ncbi:MAG: hypothetical protein H6878_09405 [Rhodobiaceae bacterium]|nr:hypothetical protein [Rhodobiaceae bacterium]
MVSLVWIIGAAGTIWLLYVYYRDQKRTRLRRARFLNACDGILDAALTTYDAFGYPKMSGRYRNLPVTVEVVVDAVAVRKLPSLWLKVTLIAPVAVASVIDLMMRPSGTEFYSPFEDLPQRVETPTDWPERAVVRTDDADQLPGLQLLAGHVGFLEHPQAKELLISPKGVRIVWQADEAQRGDYLLLRQARFDREHLEPEVLRDLIERCIAIRDGLAETQDRGQAPRRRSA